MGEAFNQIAPFSAATYSRPASVDIGTEMARAPIANNWLHISSYGYKLPKTSVLLATYIVIGPVLGASGSTEWRRSDENPVKCCQDFCVAEPMSQSNGGKGARTMCFTQRYNENKKTCQSMPPIYFGSAIRREIQQFRCHYSILYAIETGFRSREDLEWRLSHPFI